MIKQNLHTHSIYDDGIDPIEKTVETAVERGFTLLGFSGHGWNPLDDGSMSPENTLRYIEDVHTARKKTPEGLEILLGIEEDSLSPVNPDDFDYVIGSVHYLVKDGQAWPIDYSEEMFRSMLQTGWQGDIHALSEDYYQAVGDQADNPRADIIGHIDLIAKYNDNQTYFRFDDPQILAQAEKAVRRLAAAGKIFEMNTGAISRGYRTQAYPSDPILQMIRQADGKLMINTDCHNRDYLDLGMAECLERAERAGFTHLYTYSRGEFIPVSIQEFRG